MANTTLADGPALPLGRELLTALRSEAEAVRRRTLHEFRAQMANRLADLQLQAEAAARDARLRADGEIAAFGWRVSSARRASLDAELAMQSDSLRACVSVLEERGQAFQADLDAFFVKLAAIADPVELVEYAQRIPVPPRLHSEVLTVPAASDERDWSLADAQPFVPEPAASVHTSVSAHVNEATVTASDSRHPTVAPGHGQRKDPRGVDTDARSIVLRAARAVLGSRRCRCTARADRTRTATGRGTRRDTPGVGPAGAHHRPSPGRRRPESGAWARAAHHARQPDCRCCSLPTRFRRATAPSDLCLAMIARL